MRGLEKKTFVVAGGGTGIGAATALRLADEGARVIVGDFDGDAAAAVAGRISSGGGVAESAAFDVRDLASVTALLDLSSRIGGDIHGVHVNVAAMGLLLQDEDALSTELELFDATLAVNLRGHLSVTRVALPYLRSSKGAIVYTSSETAYLSDEVRYAYAVSKAGVNTLMRHVATRWGREGVRANAVAPGFTLTKAIDEHLSEEQKQAYLANTHSIRNVLPEDIAATVAFLMSDDAASINGQVINVDGGRVLRA